MISDLMRQVYQAKYDGKDFSAAEVGSKTWNEIIDAVENGRREKMREEERAEIKELNFMGIKIRPNSEVPEGHLYLLEG